MSTTPPPQFAPAAMNALAGGDAPQAPAAPVYQAPPPMASQGIFGRLLQGALNGLSGGLQQGQENIAGAGTPGFRPGGNGLAYAQQLQAQQDAKAQQAQTQKTAAAQQDFENQSKTFAANQQAQMQQVQATQAKLNGIHLEQQIQHADTDAQDQYYKGQQDQLQGILDGGGKEVAHLKVQPGQNMQDVGSAYLKDNPNLLHDPNTHITYSRDADGETEVHILNGDPNAQVDASHVNSQLASIGSERQIAPDTTMSRHDFNRVFSEESGKVADQHNAAKVEQLKFQQDQQKQLQSESAARQLESMKQAGEDRRAALAKQGLSPNADGSTNDAVASVVDGFTAPSVLLGRGKPAERAQLIKEANDYSKQKYGVPFDAEKAESDYKFGADNGNQSKLKMINNLVGDGTPQNQGALGIVHDLFQKVQPTQFPSINDTAQWLKLSSGDPNVAKLHAALLDTSEGIANVLQGGGSGGATDAKLHMAQEMLRQGFSQQQADGVLDTTRDLISSRKNNFIGSNRMLQRQYGTPATTQPAKPPSVDSQNLSGAQHGGLQATTVDAPIPAGMEKVRSKKDGKFYLRQAK